MLKNEIWIKFTLKEEEEEEKSKTFFKDPSVTVVAHI